MNKKDSIIICILIVLVLIFLSFFVKKRINSNRFVSLCEKYHMKSIDLSKQYDSSKDIKEAFICESEDNWQVEYFTFNNSKMAKDMFLVNYSDFRLHLKEASYSNYHNLLYYSEFSLVYQNTYYHVCRIRNTLVYVKVPVAYQDDAVKFIKKIGY